MLGPAVVRKHAYLQSADTFEVLALEISARKHELYLQVCRPHVP